MTVTRRCVLTAAAGIPALRAQPRKVRIGIAGGRFGATFQWHLDSGCEVAAVCDIADAARDRLATTYRCSNAYRDFTAMLKHPGLDAVGVFTPAPLHAEMAVAALKAGKHVISAVPAGLTVEELEQVLDAVKTTGLKYMMAETSYYMAPIIRCREMSAAGEFGTLFYAESEYHHEGLIKLMHNADGSRTWRHGFPPMLYPTHCTGMIVPVMRERLTEVTATGWGDKHEILRTNQYRNPFWNETAFFKTSGGHAARVAVYWHVAAGVVERGQFLGDRLSYFMHRPEGSPDCIVRIAKDGRTVIDKNNYPAGDVEIQPARDPDYFDRLPEPMRVRTGHGNSHTFLTHEFVSALREDRHPAIDIWESIAYTLPGIVAHQSALDGGRSMKIRDYGSAPGG